MIKTYLDSGILIAAAQAKRESRDIAFAILSDPEREFLTSPFVELETLPQAQFNRRALEIEFLKAYFDAAESFSRISRTFFWDVLKIASEDGLKAMDALHVTSALELGADEFLTWERPTSRLSQCRRLPIRSVRPPRLAP